MLESKKITVTLSSRNIGVIIANPNTIKAKKDLKTILKQFKDDIIKSTQVNQSLEVKNVEMIESLRTKRCRFIFDIDSTLTQGDPDIIHPEIETIFQKMTDKGIWIYLATGRSMPDLVNIINHYPVQLHSIAENGGLIIGFPPDNYLEFGKKTEPNKVLEYLQTVYGITEDMNQGERFTEVIFLQRNVTRAQIDEAISKTDARVDIHVSKNSYHISKRHINKGTAILELGKRIHWGNTLIIAVGDADMDVPMFKKAGYSFAVGNASDEAKSAASQILPDKYEKGIQDIYDIIMKST